MPWMSVRMAYLPSSPMIRPMATPATGALMGTPASIRARVLPQTVAMLVEPLLESTSLTRRRVYGKSSLLGITGIRARSARAP